MLRLIPGKKISIVIIFALAALSVALFVYTQNKQKHATSSSTIKAPASTNQKQKAPAAKPLYGTTTKQEYCFTDARLCFDVPSTWEKHSYRYSTDDVDFWYNNTSGQFSASATSSASAHAFNAQDDCIDPEHPYTRGEVLTSEKIPLTGKDSSGNPANLFIGERIFYGSTDADIAEYFLTTNPDEAQPGTFAVKESWPCPSLHDYLFTGSDIVKLGSGLKMFYPHSKQDAVDSLGGAYSRSGYWDIIKSFRYK